MEHREAAVCILQGVDNIDLAITSLMRHLSHFQKMGYVSQNEFDNVSSTVLTLMNDMFTELVEPVLKHHPEFGTRCTSCSGNKTPSPPCES